MSLSVGIIGLPNAGKSTLFNALIKKHQAEVADYPFTTVKPNVGIIEVPDTHLNIIAEKLKLTKTIPATIKFVDTAGLIKGAHKGEGLGNEFLSHIRECDCLLHVIRFFEISEIDNKTISDPELDMETIRTELYLKDLETVQKALTEKNIDPKRKSILNKIIELTNQNKSPLRSCLTQKELDQVFDLNLLSLKPILYVLNVSEKDLEVKIPNTLPKETIILSAKLESDLICLSKKEQIEYLNSLEITESSLDAVIKTSYKLLNLITFYTLLPQQVQAWPARKETPAMEGAGIIHSDFKQKFINAEVIPYSELIKFNSWQEAHQKGKIRIEGREYLICDGDMIYFRHG